MYTPMPIGITSHDLVVRRILRYKSFSTPFVKERMTNNLLPGNVNEEFSKNRMTSLTLEEKVCGTVSNSPPHDAYIYHSQGRSAEVLPGVRFFFNFNASQPPRF